MIVIERVQIEKKKVPVSEINFFSIETARALYAKEFDVDKNQVIFVYNEIDD